MHKSDSFSSAGDGGQSSSFPGKIKVNGPGITGEIITAWLIAMTDDNIGKVNCVVYNGDYIALNDFYRKGEGCSQATTVKGRPPWQLLTISIDDGPSEGLESFYWRLKVSH